MMFPTKKVQFETVRAGSSLFWEALLRTPPFLLMYTHPHDPFLYRFHNPTADRHG